MTEPSPPRRRINRCPICGRPMVVAHRPFCSERCRQVDLGRWLGGHYRIETEERPVDELPDPTKPD